MLKTVFLVLVLAGCESDFAEATRHCAPVSNQAASGCVAAYMDNAQARTNAQWDMIGASMLNRPVETSCTNIGGIVTCSSR